MRPSDRNDERCESDDGDGHDGNDHLRSPASDTQDDKFEWLWIEMDQAAVPDQGVPFEPVHSSNGRDMLRIACSLITLPALIVAVFVANEAWRLSVLETLISVVLIIGFGVVAAGWSIRRDV